MIFFLHKLFMTLATLCIITGVSAAAFFRSNRYWLKIHKSFNFLSGVFLSAGMIIEVMAVWQQKGEHLDGFHPVAGSIALGLTIASLLIGLYQFKAKNRIQIFKPLHRRLGRLAVISIMVALVSGLFHARMI
ncbi:MAG: hypothetical protein AB2L12_09000 [Smithellaceae bacterium]